MDGVEINRVQLSASTNVAYPQKSTIIPNFENLPFRAATGGAADTQRRSPGLGPPPNALLTPHHPAPPPPHNH
jgi:hypothetical protein